MSQPTRFNIPYGLNIASSDPIDQRFHVTDAEDATVVDSEIPTDTRYNGMLVYDTGRDQHYYWHETDQVFYPLGSSSTVPSGPPKFNEVLDPDANVTFDFSSQYGFEIDHLTYQMFVSNHPDGHGEQYLDFEKWYLYFDKRLTNSSDPYVAISWRDTSGQLEDYSFPVSSPADGQVLAAVPRPGQPGRWMLEWSDLTAIQPPATFPRLDQVLDQNTDKAFEIGNFSLAFGTDQTTGSIDLITSGSILLGSTFVANPTYIQLLPSTGNAIFAGDAVDLLTSTRLELESNGKVRINSDNILLGSGTSDGEFVKWPDALPTAVGQVLSTATVGAPYGATTEWIDLPSGSLWREYTDSNGLAMLRPINPSREVTVGDYIMNGDGFVEPENPFGTSDPVALTVDGGAYFVGGVWHAFGIYHCWADSYWMSRGRSPANRTITSGLVDVRAFEGDVLTLGIWVLSNGNLKDSQLIGSGWVKDGRDQGSGVQYNDGMRGVRHSVYIGTDTGERTNNTAGSPNYNVVIGYRANSTEVTRVLRMNVMLGSYAGAEGDISESIVVGASSSGGWTGETFTNQIYFSRGPALNEPYENVFFDATGAMLLPAGDSAADRPAAPIDGMLRYSKTRNTFEGRINGAWIDIPGAAGAGTIIGLNDTPGSYGQPGQVLAVSASGTDLIWVNNSDTGPAFTGYWVLDGDLNNPDDATTLYPVHDKITVGFSSVTRVEITDESVRFAGSGLLVPLNHEIRITNNDLSIGADTLRVYSRDTTQETNVYARFVHAGTDNALASGLEIWNKGIYARYLYAKLNASPENAVIGHKGSLLTNDLGHLYLFGGVSGTTVGWERIYPGDNTGVGSIRLSDIIDVEGTDLTPSETGYVLAFDGNVWRPRRSDTSLEDEWLQTKLDAGNVDVLGSPTGVARNLEFGTPQSKLNNLVSYTENVVALYAENGIWLDALRGEVRLRGQLIYDPPNGGNIFFPVKRPPGPNYVMRSSPDANPGRTELDWVPVSTAADIWRENTTEPFIYYDPAKGPALIGYGDNLPGNFSTGQLGEYGLMNAGVLYTNAEEGTGRFGVYISGFGIRNKPRRDNASSYVVIGTARGDGLTGSVIIGERAGDIGANNGGSTNNNKWVVNIGENAAQQDTDRFPDQPSPNGYNFNSVVIGYSAAAFVRDLEQSVILGGGAIKHQRNAAANIYAAKSVIIGSRSSRFLNINSITGNKWLTGSVIIGFAANNEQAGYNNLAIGTFAGGRGTLVTEPPERNNCMIFGGIEQTGPYNENNGLVFDSEIYGALPRRDNQIFFGSGGIRNDNSYLYTTVYWGVNGAMTMPHGTTAQRPPNPDEGMFRYNKDTFTFEGYFSDTGDASGLAWRTFGGGGGGVSSPWLGERLLQAGLPPSGLFIPGGDSSGARSLSFGTGSQPLASFGVNSTARILLQTTATHSIHLASDGTIIADPDDNILYKLPTTKPNKGDIIECTDPSGETAWVSSRSEHAVLYMGLRNQAARTVSEANPYFIYWNVGAFFKDNINFSTPNQYDFEITTSSAHRVYYEFSANLRINSSSFVGAYYLFIRVADREHPVPVPSSLRDGEVLRLQVSGQLGMPNPTRQINFSIHTVPRLSGGSLPLQSGLVVNLAGEDIDANAFVIV